jgi:ribosome biogenesis GTPase
MSSKKKKQKLRVEFKKKYQGRQRQGDVTKDFLRDDPDTLDAASSERISGKGRLTRRRTIMVDAESSSHPDDVDVASHLNVDEPGVLSGRVLEVHGLQSYVEAEDGSIVRCATRRLLKTMSTDQRHIVAAGDRVRFRMEGSQEGVILRIETRTSILSRSSKGRQHIIVANVDQLLIVTSAAQPALKPNLIDRFLVTAEQNQLDPVLCINKVDLIDPAELQALVGVYSRLGYRTILTSAEKNWGIEPLRDIVRDRQTVVAGQSGVGKSSILNAIQPGLELRVQRVSDENEKGKHTTTTAKLIRLDMGGYIVDTPGIRQFQLWDIAPQEIAGLFREIRPYANFCRFPNCQHEHEVGCAVKNAVADDRIDARRYESYCHLMQAEPEKPDLD